MLQSVKLFTYLKQDYKTRVSGLLNRIKKFLSQKSISRSTCITMAAEYKCNYFSQKANSRQFAKLEPAKFDAIKQLHIFVIIQTY